MFLMYDYRRFIVNIGRSTQHERHLQPLFPFRGPRPNTSQPTPALLSSIPVGVAHYHRSTKRRVTKLWGLFLGAHASPVDSAIIIGQLIGEQIQTMNCR